MIPFRRTKFPKKISIFPFLKSQESCLLRKTSLKIPRLLPKKGEKLAKSKFRKNRKKGNPKNLKSAARSAFDRTNGLHRRLRHQCRSPPCSGSRHLAEQSAPPDGSFWHQRNESRSEWRAELLNSRRLLGRGIQWQEWICNR